PLLRIRNISGMAAHRENRVMVALRPHGTGSAALRTTRNHTYRCTRERTVVTTLRKMRRRARVMGGGFRDRQGSVDGSSEDTTAPRGCRPQETGVPRRARKDGPPDGAWPETTSDETENADKKSVPHGCDTLFEPRSFQAEGSEGREESAQRRLLHEVRGGGTGLRGHADDINAGRGGLAGRGATVPGQGPCAILDRVGALRPDRAAPRVDDRQRERFGTLERVFGQCERERLRARLPDGERSRKQTDRCKGFAGCRRIARTGDI